MASNTWDSSYMKLRPLVCSAAVSLHTRAARGGDDGCVFALQNVSAFSSVWLQTRTHAK